jgi:transposase
MPPTRTLPTPENASLEELQTAIRCAPTQRSSGRLTAIKALILGIDFPVAAKLAGVDVRTLQRWVGAFNKQGIDGLIERPRSGRPRKIAKDKAPQVVDLVEHPEKAGHAHWTGRKLHGHLRREFDLEIGYSTLMRFLREQRFRLKVPQPWPDRQDPQLREAFCRKLKALAEDEAVELWFGDETGIEGDPRPRRRFIKVGEKGRVTKNGDHLRMNVCGIVNPRTGRVFLAEFSHSDTDVFQAFLDEANRHLEFGRERQVLILDNASWHKAARLSWGRFEPLYLPPYSPDLNPIERLWLLIKGEWFTDFVAKDRDDLIARLDKALLWAIDRGPQNSKTCSIKTEL